MFNNRSSESIELTNRIDHRVRLLIFSCKSRGRFVLVADMTKHIASIKLYDFIEMLCHRRSDAEVWFPLRSQHDTELLL